MTAWGAAG